MIPLKGPAASAYRVRAIAAARDIAARMRNPGTTPYTLIELAGIALLAVAAGFVHIAYGIAVVGFYLFASAILAQLTDDSEDKERGAK